MYITFKTIKPQYFFEFTKPNFHVFAKNKDIFEIDNIVKIKPKHFFEFTKPNLHVFANNKNSIKSSNIQNFDNFTKTTTKDNFKKLPKNLPYGNNKDNHIPPSHVYVLAGGKPPTLPPGKAAEKIPVPRTFTNAVGKM